MQFIHNRDLFFNLQGIDGSLALHHAAYAGDLNIIKLLVNHGAVLKLLKNKYLDAKNDDGSTPLMFAASGGYFHVVGYFLERGSSVNTTNKVKLIILCVVNQLNLSFSLL